MNTAAHQEMKNEETKTDKRKAGKGRRQATDSKEAACCPSVVIQEAAQQKNDLCDGSAWGNRDPQEGQQPFSSNPNRVRNCTTTLLRFHDRKLQNLRDKCLTT